MDLEPLEVPFDSKVIPIMSDKELPTTVTLVTSAGNNTGDIVSGNSEGVDTRQVAGDVSLVADPVDSTVKDDHTSYEDKPIVVSSDENVDYMGGPGLTKEQVDKSSTSGLRSGTSKAPSTLASQAKPGSLIGKCNNESSPLHLRNRVLSGDYFLPSSPPDSALKHRSQEVKTLYDISLHSACAATYQHLVARGKGTNCFDIPDPWPKLHEL